MDTSQHPAERAARRAVLITALLAALKVLIWMATSSLAILSQALDSLLDVVALGLVLVAVRLAHKPADTEHHYGHSKAENLVAFTQTLLLGALVVGVSIGAVGRLLSGAHTIETPWYAFATLGASAVIDAFRVRSLINAARAQRSEALKAGALNLVMDVGTAVVALVSLALVSAGLPEADAVGALLVAAAVSYGAFVLGKRSVDVLMDRAPVHELQGAIEQAAMRAAGVAETRRVRVRGTADQLFADVTVAAGRTASLERAHDIAEAVEREIEGVAPGTDVVVHVEPTADRSDLVERVQAAASRTEDVHEVHNVLIHAFNEAGHTKLHVTLHAKVRPWMSLEQAHSLSDRIEAEVALELGEAIRVDTHIEPLRSTELGRDVTAQREDIVRSVQELAIQEPDVLDAHEVLITSTVEGLSVMAHVHGRRDLPLAQMHDASDRVEKAIRDAHPEIATVTIHFEPA